MKTITLFATFLALTFSAAAQKVDCSADPCNVLCNPCKNPNCQYPNPGWCGAQNLKPRADWAGGDSTAQPIPALTIQNRTIYVKADKSIEALEFLVTNGVGGQNYKQFVVKLTAPLVRADQSWPLGVGDSAVLLSAAYSDGTDWPESTPDKIVGARRLATFRDQFLADQHPDIAACDCGGATTMRLLRDLYRKAYPTRALPAIDTTTAGTDAGKIPPAQNPGWFLRPIYTSIVYDGVPMSPLNANMCLDSTFSEGGPDPIIISVNQWASCPLQYPYNPTTGVSANGADVCPVGSPFSTADIFVSSMPLYGPNGLESDPLPGPLCAQTWGFIATSSADFDGETLEASMQNSCMLSNPIYSGTGGFGSCSGPGGVQGPRK